MAESQLYRYVILNPAALRMCATKKRERGESLRERRESRAFIIELIEQEQQLQKPNRNPEDLMVETCKNHGKHPWFPLPTVRSLGELLCATKIRQDSSGQLAKGATDAWWQSYSFPVFLLLHTVTITYYNYR